MSVIFFLKKPQFLRLHKRGFQVLSHAIPPAPPDGHIDVVSEARLPARAQVVIGGSGMIGNSVAFHLIQNGWKDVVILDKGNIADGTSKTGSGMCGLFRPSHERTIVQYCIELYRLLQKQGYDIGLVECGSLNLANSKDRFISLQRRANRYKPTGLDCHVLLRNEINDFHPYLYTEDLAGAVWVPEDAVVHPKKVSEVLAYLAFKGGARFVNQCGVKRILTQTSSLTSSSSNVCVSGVETENGQVIECEYFVNCSGIWAREVGKLSSPSVKVPICPAEHFFLSFKDIPEMADKQLPCVRDYDNHIYLRRWKGSFLMGAFEPKARPWKLGHARQARTHTPGNESESTDISHEHWIHMSSFIASAINRMPLLKEAPYEMLTNTPDAFTPDGRWILGEAPEISRYYICAGMNGNSLQGAGGVGKAVADWMVNGRPPGNMLFFEPARFTTLHNNQHFLSLRTPEVVSLHYQIRYPLVEEFSSGRNIRTSPIHCELQARGAVFGEKMGWEMPLYFVPHHSREDPPAQLPRGTFGKPEFFDNIEEEYLACRETVGLADLSSLAKLMIKGKSDSVVNYLQTLCSNNVDIPVGGIVSTGMHNEDGGYENDCILIRQTPTSYFMVSPAQQQTRIVQWMQNHLPADNSVGLQDVTSMYTALSLTGPKSRDLMQQMTNSDINMLPFTYKYVNMGYASGVMVFAFTQTGEPGYSIYVPSEYALHLYNKMMTIGHDYGIKNVGHLALRFMRIEKMIMFWGEELTSVTTPNEVNRAYKVKFNKKHFIGKSSILAEKIRGVNKRLVQFQLNDFDKDVHTWPGGGETVYRNGDFVGVVTNPAYGFTLQKMVCLAFVQHPDTIRGYPTIIDNSWLSDRSATWTINIAGNMFAAKIRVHPPSMPIMNQDFSVRGPNQSKKYGPHVEVLRKV